MHNGMLLVDYIDHDHAHSDFEQHYKMAYSLYNALYSE